MHKAGALRVRSPPGSCQEADIQERGLAWRNARASASSTGRQAGFDPTARPHRFHTRSASECQPPDTTREGTSRTAPRLSSY
jgi:hypothetical protein